MAAVTQLQPVPLQSKFHKLRERLGDTLIERNTIIETMMLALISKSHHYQLGEPGVAKSLSIRELVSLIDGLTGDDCAEMLLTRFTNPEEAFGPVSLKALEQDRYVFQTAGYLPDAKIWFLDEIFKANAAILNAFLMALNERRFRNDGRVYEIPLWSMFCASNELPEGEELNALYDRIHFRHVVRRIQEPGNFIAMLQHGGSNGGPVITWDEVEQAHDEAMQVEIPNDVFEALNKVRNDLKADGVEPTDRRFKECLRIIRAAAWLDGVNVAEIEHLRPLAHVLWTAPEEAPKVERLLLEMANPLDKEALALLEIVEGLATELDKVIAEKDIDPTLRNKRGVELHSKVDRAKDDLAKLLKQVKASGRKSAKVEEVRQRLLSVTRRLLKQIFNIEGEPAL